ncbi:MAG: hypothetical protein AB7J28_11390 [Hyphomonadaceae bacterium]
MSSIVIEERFCGPPGFGNGGYVSGVIAEALGGVSDVTLKAPTPLEKALQLDVADGRAELRDGEILIATGARRDFAMEVPAPVSLEETQRAGKRYAGFVRHAFPNCFVCGPARAEGDGLRVFSGAVEGREGLFAGVWRPSCDLADASGQVRDAFLWAALDCPGYFAIDAGPAVLGRFHGAVTGQARAGEPVIVLSWALESEGRKHGAGSALYDASGALIAAARATWVKLAADSRFTVAAS